MLQTVLENAVWHGIMPLKRKGEIILDASQSTQNEVIVKITDNGNGMPVQKLKQEKESYGLCNIREKIDILDKLYDKKIIFELSNLPENSGLVAKFIFPEMKDNYLEQ